MPYAYTFEYIKGSDNLVADALSRCPYMLNTVTVIHSMLAGLLACMKVTASQDLQYQQDLLELHAGQPPPSTTTSPAAATQPLSDPVPSPAAPAPNTQDTPPTLPIHDPLSSDHPSQDCLSAPHDHQPLPCSE